MTRQTASGHVATAKYRNRNELKRLRGAQADLAELEAAERRAELVQTDAMRQAIGAITVMLGNQLDAFPGRLAAPLSVIDDPAIIRHVIRDEVIKLREILSAEFDKLALQFDVPADRPAAEPDRGRVGGAVPDTADGER